MKTQSPHTILEQATKTLEKERAFLNSLVGSQDSARVLGRIFGLVILVKTSSSSIPLYLFEKRQLLFLHNPDKVFSVISFLLEEITRYIRLSAYLGSKGIFPDAVTVLRNSVELLGVLTHIWHEPRKVEFFGQIDSQDYSKAFRFTNDKRINLELKKSGKKYRFAYCKFGDILSKFYDGLSSHYVHSTSLHNIGLPIEKDDELSCFFVDRVHPEKLLKHYEIMQALISNIYLEIYRLIPSEHAMHAEIQVLTLLTASLFPILSNPNTELEANIEELFEEAIKTIGNLKIIDQ